MHESCQTDEDDWNEDSNPGLWRSVLSGRPVVHAAVHRRRAALIGHLACWKFWNKIIFLTFFPVLSQISEFYRQMERLGVLFFATNYFSCHLMPWPGFKLTSRELHRLGTFWRTLCQLSYRTAAQVFKLLLQILCIFSLVYHQVTN